MKTRWGSKPLGDLCDFQRGLTYSKKDETDQPGTTVLRATNIDLATNLLDLSDLRFIRDSVPVPASKRIKPERLLICTASGSKSHLGKVAYIDVEADYAFGGFMGMLTPKADLLPRYLFHAMTAPAYKAFIGSLTDGANINNLRFDSLARFSIPVPPLPEQRRIVAILDEAFEGIAAAKANAEKNLQSAREVFEAQRECLLSGGEHGWAEKPVGELCGIKHGFAFQSKYFANDGDYICLTPGNFFEDGGYRDRCDKTKYYSGPIPKGFILSAGQMLVAMTEQAPGLLGSPAIVPEGQRFLHNQRLGLICPKEGTPWVNDFFFHVFNRPSFRKAVHRTATGVKVRHTSPSKLGQISVSFPASECDQRKAAAGISKLQQEVECHQEISRRKICALADLKASLLHQAFTGQL